MSFLTLLVALALHQILRPGNALQRDAWLYRLDAALGDQTNNDWLRVGAVLALTLMLGYWLLHSTSQWLFGLPELMLSTVMLVWALGRADYYTALERYEALRDSNNDAAVEATRVIWMPADTLAGPSAPSGDAPVPALMRLAYGGYSRWFAPVFFCVVAGPLGAVGYRTLSLLARRDNDPVSLTLLRVVDWLPVRLLCLSFALAGDFTAVTRPRLLTAIGSVQDAPTLLCDCACAATGATQSARPIGELMFRSAGFWLLLFLVIFMLD